MAADTLVPPTEIWGKEGTGITWNGQQEAISRLLLGYGTRLGEVLELALGVPQDQVEPAVNAIKEYMGVSLIAPGMPIQDGIDLAEFLVDLTIKYSRFSFETQTVGGPIEIAAITKHEGFMWVKRKHYFDHGLNMKSDYYGN